MKNIRNLALLLVCAFSLSVASSATPKTVAVPFPKGITGDPITIQYEKFGSGPVFINVHENESTSVQAARAVLVKRGGLLVTLKQSGTRNITLTYNGERFAVDPNRIFTTNGMIASIEALSGRVEDPVVDFIDRLGTEILTVMAKHSYSNKAVVMALHNNTDGELSVDSYDAKKPFRQGIARVSKNPSADPDDFFLVTTKQIFDALVAQKKWNVVLQDSATVDDDGSLSVLTGWSRVPYVNIEAQHGHLSVQTKMIEALHEALRTRVQPANQ